MGRSVVDIDALYYSAEDPFVLFFSPLTERTIEEDWDWKGRE
jgi:hypothetical protein